MTINTLILMITTGGWYVIHPFLTCVSVKRARWPYEKMSSGGPYLEPSWNASGGIYTMVPGKQVRLLAS